jgi:hypothetical protein
MHIHRDWSAGLEKTRNSIQYWINY